MAQKLVKAEVQAVLRRIDLLASANGDAVTRAACNAFVNRSRERAAITREQDELRQRLAALNKKAVR